MKKTLIHSILIYTIIANFSSLAKAQDSLTARLLTIGNTRDIPAITIGQSVLGTPIDKIIQYPVSKANISDFKGKLLILDFWHQYCSSCIAEFPILEKLQKTFGDSIVIMPVTYQSKKTVLNFFSLRKKMGMPINMPTIFEDTLFRKMFPHVGEPHEIWIGPDGKVKAITEANAITAKNIRGMLSGKISSLPVSKKQLDFNQLKPLLVNNNGGPDSAFLYRSQFTGYIDSIKGPSFLLQEEASMTRLFISNQPILNLYRAVYANMQPPTIPGFYYDLMNKRIIIEVKDSSRFRQVPEYTTDEEWKFFLQKNLFNYELILPPTFSKSDALKIAISDINRFFKLHSVMEKRTVSCLALVQTNDTGINQLKSKKGLEKIEFSKDKSQFTITNKTIESLVDLFNVHLPVPFVVNKTGYTNNIDINMNFDNADYLSSIRKQLRLYGLDLIESQQEMDMLVIKDAN